MKQSLNKNKMFYKSLYKYSKERQIWVQSYQHSAHHKNIEWKEYTNNECVLHWEQKKKHMWMPQEKKNYTEKKQYHWNVNLKDPYRVKICY